MSASFKMPAVEIEGRVLSLQENMQQTEIEAILIVQRVDLLYFAGTAQNGFLYIPAHGDPLLLIKRYAARAREESSIHHIIEITSPKEVPGHIVDVYGRLPDTLAFELDVLPVTHFDFYRQLFPIKVHMD